MQNEPSEIEIIFTFCYNEVNDGVENTKHLLLERLFPLTPTSVYVSEMGRIYYSLIFLPNIPRFDNILATIISFLLKNYSYFKKLGSGFSLWEFEIFINYHISLSVLFKSEQLKLLADLHTVFTGDVESTSISTNSIQRSDKNDGSDCHDFEMISENYDGEYYQLIFYTQCESSNQAIVNHWDATYHAKYTSFQHWSYDQERMFTNSTCTILSIHTEKTNILFEWNEIQSDLFNFIRQNKSFIDMHASKIVFGVYNFRYDGGEIGISVIPSLIELGMDLLITRSIRPPFI